MADYGYNWKDDEVTCYQTRHLPKVLLKRMKVLASQLDHSVEWVLNQALDIGLAAMERRRK